MKVCPSCLWKNEEDSLTCAMCGKRLPEREKKVQVFGSTLKVNPKKRPKRSRIKHKPSDGKLPEVMKEVAFRNLKEYGEPTCENCGLKFREYRYSNVSHIRKRSTDPDKRTDVDNMEVLCSAENFWGMKDESCHTTWERNDHKTFNELKGSRKGQVGT